MSVTLHRRHGVAALAVGLSVAAGCVMMDSSRPPGGAEPGEVQFEFAGPGGVALVVPVRINGRGPYSFVLDTGATITCVDQALADELELPEPVGTVGFGGTAEGFGRMRLVSIESLEVGSTARATDLRGCAIDLSRMQSAGIDVHGLVGLNFLRAYRVTLDFQDRTVRLDALPDDAAIVE